MTRKLCISATFTAEPIAESVRFWSAFLDLPVDLKFAAFNQLFQTLLDPGSIFAHNSDGLNVALLRWHDLGKDAAQIRANANALIETLITAAGTMRVPLVVISCPESLAVMREAGTAELSRELNRQLLHQLEKAANVYHLAASQILELYPVERVHDSMGERLGSIPYTADFFTAVGTAIIRKLDLFCRKPVKVIAVDLDNTLWQGVAGEDGPENLRLDENRLAFHRFLLQQRNDGLLLVIVSKNNEDDAWEVFRNRPEMILSQEHFTSWRINWKPKPANLQELAEELSLGLESFIFLDDSAKEIGEAELALPEIRTLRLPDNAAEIGGRVRHFWPFDRQKITDEDRKRNEGYRQERARTLALRNSASLEEFIAGLDLRVTISPLTGEHLSRVAQLTLRTNQFNATGIRRNEAQLRSILASGATECVTISAQDRFGDYGIVGAVIFSVDRNRLDIESFMLSCRALGRGVEHSVVRHLGEVAKAHHVEGIDFNFVPSKKNQPVLSFLESLPATREPSPAGEIFRVSTESAVNFSFRAVGYSDAETALVTDATVVRSSELRGTHYAYIAEHLNSIAAIRAEMRTSRANLLTSDTEAASSELPRNEIEKKLLQIWSEVLRLSSVRIHDNFFDLGGDSLMAVDLLLRIVEVFGAEDLTLSAVIEAPTVAEFAKALESRTPQFRCLIPIRETGTRPPFFCVPGAGGNVLSLRPLAMNLPSDQPFWCLQAPGLDGSQVVDSVVEIAKLYLKEVREIQPRGPYYIGGASYGGVIAFEMAQQFRSEGEEVSLLALLDTYNLAYSQMIPKLRVLYCNARFFTKRSWNALKHLASSPLKLWPRSLYNASLALWKHLSHLLSTFTSAPVNQKQAVPAGPVRGTTTDSTGYIDVLTRVRDANMRAVEEYVPSVYDGSVTVLAAEMKMIEPYEDPNLGWLPVAGGGIHCETVPGDHISFLDSKSCAEAVDRCLRKSQQRVNTSDCLSSVEELPPARSAAAVV